MIPIINENDTISVSEILHINKFGDNDTLSAIAAGMCGADYLFLLTDVEGLYEDNPRKVPGARLVTKVRDIEAVRQMGTSPPLLPLSLSSHLSSPVSTSSLGSSLGTGGMETKLIAAELATAAGCATVITLGAVPSRILTIVQSHAPPSLSPSLLPGVEFSSSTSTSSLPPHTLFTPKPRPLTSRRFWILHGLTPRGTIYIDEGAYRAISRVERDGGGGGGGGGGNGGRLLAAGVLRVEGTFGAGQAVRVCVIRGRWGASGGRGKDTPEMGGRPSEGRLEERLEGLELHEGAVGDEGEREEETVLEFGRGLTNYNSSEIDRIKGMRS